MIEPIRIMPKFLNFLQSTEFGNWETWYQNIQMIQVDIGGHPPIPLVQKQLFQFGSFSMIFRVLKFQGHFEALKDVFLAS